MTRIIDSYAWIEFLSAGRAGPKVREIIESSEELVTPDIVLAEVARVLGRAGGPAAAVAGHLRSISALSSVRPISIEVALEVVRSDQELRQHARNRRLGPPSFADVLILSYARHFRATVVTADHHFEGLGETAWIGS